MRHKIRLFFAVTLLLISSTAYAQGGQALSEKARVETVQFKSKLVGATLPYSVVFPSEYDSTAATNVRYPVVYLLHGFGGHSVSWLHEKGLTEWATQQRLIIVAPEGNNGWWTDSATVSTDKYETYIVQELIPEIQRRYRTIAARRARSIVGFSMGGYGAVKFGLKHPEQFGLAASFAGPTTTASWTDATLKDAGALGRSIMETFGPVGSQTRAANDLFKLVRESSPQNAAKLPYLYLVCGDKDLLIDDNREMNRLLSSQEVVHEYHEVSGGHNLALYGEHLRAVMKIAGRTRPRGFEREPTMVGESIGLPNSNCCKVTPNPICRAALEELPPRLASLSRF